MPVGVVEGGGRRNLGVSKKYEFTCTNSPKKSQEPRHDVFFRAMRRSMEEVEVEGPFSAVFTV